VAAYEMAGHVKVDLDLEVDPHLTLEAAHDQATNLESEIKEKVPEVKEVTIHLEPLPQEVEVTGGSAASQRAIEEKLLEIAHKTLGVLDCHSIEARQAGKAVIVSLHCTLDPDLPVAQAHDITERLKASFRQAFPQIMKVNIHAEPRARQ
jgi:divalent metal cation (Fe/Co/Zn/Cd) transporter